MNLLIETIEVLNQNNKTEENVLYVGDGFDKMTWDVFKDKADFEYDNGYGGEEIAFIIVYGDDFWLERHEYDGSEWWEFKTPPKIPNGDDVDAIIIKLDD